MHTEEGAAEEGTVSFYPPTPPTPPPYPLSRQLQVIIVVSICKLMS